MLEKKPYLTPAQICEALETTATKLSETKSNETGSGCINAMLALNESENYEDITSINDNDDVNVNIYPNPVDDRLYIETLTQTLTQTIEIYDIYGRRQQLSAISHQPSVIDVSNLNSGIYFVKISTEEGDIVKRIIKK